MYSFYGSTTAYLFSLFWWKNNNDNSNNNAEYLICARIALIAISFIYEDTENPERKSHAWNLNRE